MKNFYLENEFEVYEKKVEFFALLQYETFIKPYLLKNDLYFRQGNGAYLVATNKGSYDYNNKLPKKIKSILEMDVPGFDKMYFCLANFMPNSK